MAITHRINPIHSIPAQVFAKHARLPDFLQTEAKHRDPGVRSREDHRYVVAFIDKGDGNEGQIVAHRFRKANQIANDLIAEGHQLLHIWSNLTHGAV